MRRLFEQDPTLGAPEGKQWVRNVETGNVYAVDQETAAEEDVYEEPSAKTIAGRYAGQFEEGGRISIDSDFADDFQAEVGNRGASIGDRIEGNGDETHFIFTSTEDYETAENVRSSVVEHHETKQNAMKLKKLIRETAKDVIREASFPEARGDKVWVYNTNNNDVYAVDKETAEEGDQYEVPEKHMVPGTEEYKKKRKMPKFCVEPNKASEFVKGMEEEGFNVDEDPNTKPEDKICFRPKEHSSEVEAAADKVRGKGEYSENVNRNAMKLTESQLRNIIREELSNVIQEKKKQQVNELSFREDKMRELLSREPKLQRIRNDAGHSLKTMFDMYVVRNKEMKRQYKQASPQPQGG